MSTANGKHFGSLRDETLSELVTYASRTCRRNYLTTGQVARICGVAPRTACKWFEAGMLNGFRIPNGDGDVGKSGSHRRISLASLVEFLKKLGYTEALEKLLAPQTVVSCGLAEAEQLASLTGRRILAMFCLFSLGAVVERVRPAAVVLDAGAVGQRAALEAARLLRDYAPPPLAVVVWPEDEAPPGLAGWNFLRRPFDLARLAEILGS